MRVHTGRGEVGRAGTISKVNHLVCTPRHRSGPPPPPPAPPPPPLLPPPPYFHSFLIDMFLSVSFFITLATLISKSSCSGRQQQREATDSSGQRGEGEE